MSRVAPINSPNNAPIVRLQAKDVAYISGGGALFFSADSYFGQKQYIKNGEDYFNKVFDMKIYKNAKQSKAETLRDSYLKIIRSKNINRKLIFQAALKGSIAFAVIFALSKFFIEHIFKMTKK